MTASNNDDWHNVPPHGKKVTCVVCNHTWEAVPCDGYYECPELDCGYLNPVPWRPAAEDDWRQ